MRFPLITIWYGATYTTLYWQDTKIKRNLWICERAERAELKFFLTFSQSKTYFLHQFVGTSDNFCQKHLFFRSRITSAYIIHNQCTFLLSLYGMMLYIYKRQYTDKTLTLRKCMYLKLLFPSIFCWYLRYFVSETHLMSGVNILHTYIQSMQFPFITHGMVLYKRQYTDKTLTLKKCMCMHASERSERA